MARSPVHVVVVVVVMVAAALCLLNLTKYRLAFVPFPGEDGRLAGEKMEMKSYECVKAKRILIWTSYWGGYSNLWEKVYYRLVSKQCPESRCELIYDHRLLHTADAVLYHAIDMKPDLLPSIHPPHQPWIFFSLESPSTILDHDVSLSMYKDVFNWTMTYRRDSDIVVPYGRFVPRPVPINSDKDFWASKTKTKLAAWAVSHCDTESRREWFVKDLVKYMPVDVFGRCGTKKCGRNISIRNIEEFNQTECNKKIQEYMFYLAFENSICLDYISEKFYQTLTLEVVPVVLGGGPYTDVAPPNSYIDAFAFPSPKHLARYLTRLAENREEYNKYFAWKQHFTIELGHPFFPFICDLCAKLHDPASLLPPNTTRSPMERAGVVGVVQGRGSSGSYPNLETWFVNGSGCRRWWAGDHDYRKHAHRDHLR